MLSEKAKKIGEQPAFPFVIPATLVPAYLADDATAKTMYLPGLTIRQEFARTAMQGLLACPGADPTELAENAIGWADALLEALAKEGG